MIGEFLMSSKKRKQEIIEILSKCESIGGIDRDLVKSKEYYTKLLILRDEFDSDSEKLSLLNLLKAFGNYERFLILEFLRENNRCVCELEAVLGKTQPAVSHHLRVLEEQGLIQGWKKGKFTHYSLIKTKFEEFRELWLNWAKKISNWFGAQIIS